MDIVTGPIPAARWYAAFGGAPVIAKLRGGGSLMVRAGGGVVPWSERGNV